MDFHCNEVARIVQQNWTFNIYEFNVFYVNYTVYLISYLVN